MKNFIQAIKELQEEKPGLWANIRAKRARGEKPAHKNSNAHKDAVKAGKKINKSETKEEDQNYTKKPATYAGRPVIVHMNGPETEWKVEILGNGKIVDYIDMMANLKFDDGTTYMDYLKEEPIQEEEVKSGKKVMNKKEMINLLREVLQEETKLSKDTLIVLSVIDHKRNLDNDQIKTIFEDTPGTFYIYTNEEGEYENTKKVTKEEAYMYVDYYNARTQRNSEKEEFFGAKLRVLGIESELHFKVGEFSANPDAFSKNENYKDGKVKGKSKPGRVKKSGASCKGSVSSLRAKAKNAGGEKGKMYHWCANMKGGKKK